MATELWAVGLVLVCSFANAFGAIYMKKGAKRFNLNIIKQLTNWTLILGCFLYVLSSVLFIAALRGGDVSLLYPITALAYVWVSMLSIRMVGEHMNRTKWAGVAIIVLSIAVISFAL